MPAPGPTGHRPSINVCGWTKEGKPQNALTWSAGSLVFQEAQLLLAEGWLKLWASPCTFFIRHNGLFLSCILLICLSTETYYLLDFCNSSAPKSTVCYAENSKATERKTRTMKPGVGSGEEGNGEEGQKQQARKEWWQKDPVPRKVAARPGSRELEPVLSSAQPLSVPTLVWQSGRKNIMGKHLKS